MIPMKNLLRFLFASTLALPVALCAASFEGKVFFKVTDAKGKTAEMSQSIKGDKMRMESPGKAKGAMIVDGSKKEMLMMMDDEKMYMVMAVPDAAVEAGKQAKEEATIEKTSTTEKILGYTATKYISTDKDGSKTELWLAEGLGSFMSMNQGGGGGGMFGGGRGSKPSPTWERALSGTELFPLRVVIKDKKDKETFRQEVTSIEKQKLPDTLFVPPEGYQKFDMGGMMKGMIPGFGK